MSELLQDDIERALAGARIGVGLSSYDAESLLVRLQAENARLTSEVARLREAYRIAYAATYQSHSGHWDMTMQNGAGCHECILAREAREKCDALATP